MLKYINHSGPTPWPVMDCRKCKMYETHSSSHSMCHALEHFQDIWYGHYAIGAQYIPDLFRFSTISDVTDILASKMGTTRKSVF
jgi:hypothetical protein